MNLVDIHSHLEHKQFTDLPQVIERASSAGLKLIITAGINLETNKQALKISEKYPLVKPSFGIYPPDALNNEISSGESADFSTLVSFNLAKEMEFIKKNIDKCIAIGEIGLDFNFTSPDKELQEKIFTELIELAHKSNKPIIVHSRKAESRVLELLEKHQATQVILHCFCGSKSLIEKAVSLGYLFSIPPAITRWQNFQSLVSLVSLTHLLTETDSPYLSYKPSSRNEPANVQVTINEIAKIKNLSPQKVSEIMFNNALKLFRI